MTMRCFLSENKTSYLLFQLQMANAAAIAAAFGGGLPPGITGTNDRCTVLVSNLNPDVSTVSGFFQNILSLSQLIQLQICLFQRIDEDKLFNLFSIYGNIVRIKLLRNKPDHALIQMGDGFQAELAVHFLKVCFRYTFLFLYYDTRFL